MPPPSTSPLLVAVLAVSLLCGCSDGACDALPELQEEREQRRAEQQRLVEARTTSDDGIAEADDRLHAFERRVFELEQSCARG